MAGKTLWDRLKERLDPPKPAPPKPVPPPPVDPGLPPPGAYVTPAVDFRNVGTLTPERFCEILARTPMEGECRAIHAAVGGRAVPLAQSYKESEYGANENARATKNPLGLLWFEGSPIERYLSVDVGGARIKLLIFPNYAAAFAEWARRMDDPRYKGGVYPGRMTLGDFIRTYVAGPGPGYANGESAASVKLYLDQTVARLNRYFGHYQPDPTWGDTATGTRPTKAGFKAWAVAGSKEWLWLPEDLPFKVALTPIGGNRSGRKMRWQGVTQHSTNNYRPGMGAEAHSKWQDSGTPGNPGIGVHFYVDDKIAIQKIPVDEMGVHAGEPRNSTNTAVELATNPDRVVAKAEANSRALVAGQLAILGTTALARMDPHTFNAEGHCPDISLPWSEWERLTDEARARITGG